MDSFIDITLFCNCKQIANLVTINKLFYSTSNAYTWQLLYKRDFLQLAYTIEGDDYFSVYIAHYKLIAFVNKNNKNEILDYLFHLQALRLQDEMNGEYVQWD